MKIDLMKCCGSDTPLWLVALTLLTGCGLQSIDTEANVRNEVESLVAASRPPQPKVGGRGAGFVFRDTKGEIIEVDLTLCNVNEEILNELQQLPELKRLVLAGTKTNDSLLRLVAKFSGLVSLDLQHTDVTDAGVAALHVLPSLEELVLADCHITDDGLESLTRSQKLHTLSLTRCPINDAGMAHVGMLRKLRNLQMDYCVGIGDPGLARLEELKDLKAIGLVGTEVTNRAMPSLARHTELSSIRLDQTSVGDVGLEHLSSLGHLEYLSLNGCKNVTDQGIRHLAAMRSLRVLALINTRITDGSLEDLKNLTGLTNLCVDGTRITRSGRDALREALPRTLIPE